MTPVDWRDLYASNQSVIEQHLPGGRLRLPASVAAPGGFPRLPGSGPLTTSPPASGNPMQRLEAGGRPVFVHTPPTLPSGPVPLVVMLHGCTQNAADFARGTQMNALADRHGFVVAYPEQIRKANGQGCWNWFEAQHQKRDAGEPAVIAGAARLVAEVAAGSVTIDSDRVYVAGMSAGGAMAAVMGATHPDVFAGIAVHSGLPFASATGMGSALQAMTRGAGDPSALAATAHRVMGALARPVPALVIHGTADRTVCPVNGTQTIDQWLATNRLAAGIARGDGEPTSETKGRSEGGRDFTASAWHEDGRLIGAYLEVDGLGHAWSGGSPTGTYTDQHGPDASEAIVKFFGLDPGESTSRSRGSARAGGRTARTCDPCGLGYPFVVAIAVLPPEVLRAELAHGLSDVSRQSLLEALRGGERRVVDLVEETGLSQPNVSKHLRCLRGCGLVTCDKRGREVFYALAETVRGVLDVLDAAAAELAPQMAACQLTDETVGCCS